VCSFYSTIIPVLFVVVIAVFDTVCVKVGVCFCICNVCPYLPAWCLPWPLLGCSEFWNQLWQEWAVGGILAMVNT